LIILVSFARLMSMSIERPLGGALAYGLLALGVLLLLDSVVCIYGFKTAYYGSIGLSAILLAAVLLSRSPSVLFRLVELALTLLTIVLDVAALVPAPKLQQGAHPKDHPVFG